MVQPGYIAAIVVELLGIGLVAASSATGAFWPGGALDPLVLGSVLIGLGIGVGMVAGGVRHPVVLAVVPVLVVFALIAVGVFQWLGAGVRL